MFAVASPLGGNTQIGTDDRGEEYKKRVHRFLKRRELKYFFMKMWLLTELISGGAFVNQYQGVGTS